MCERHHRNMNLNTKLHLWRYLPIVAMAVIILVLSLLPSKSFPVVHWALADKVVHLVLYMGLMWAVLWLLSTSHWQLWLIGCVCSIAYGGLIEVLQALTSSRSASWGDVCADIVGVLIGLLTYLFFRKIMNGCNNEHSV